MLIARTLPWLAIITLVGILSFFTVPLLHAQSDPYLQYLKDLNTYSASRKVFDSSAARYYSFKTIQSKETVTQDAKTMLQNGRSTLTQYTFYLGQNVSNSEAVNDRVKNEILKDLQLHNGYLQSLENVLSETPTFTEINTQSAALKTRYGYVYTTAEQALLYFEAIRSTRIIREVKQYLSQMDDLNRTLPDTLREKSLAATWIETARNDTSEDEAQLITLTDNIYPQQTQSATGEIRAFEGTPSRTNQKSITDINNRLQTRLSKARETVTIMIEGYKDL